jgi:hypothetical protein
MRSLYLAAALIVGAASIATAAPQAGPPDATPNAQAPGARRDFMFGRPRGWVSLRGSWLKPAESGELFAFVADQLTIEKGAFQSAAFTGEVGFAIAPRLEGAVTVESGKRTVASEYRRFIDNFGLPINQTTILTQTNLAGGVRYALAGRGRDISRFAFVPKAIVPFVGAGGGVYYHRLSQVGDFVDFVTLKVFKDAFRSEGWSPSAHVFGGADVRMWRNLFLTADVRYVWTHADLGPDFVGFDGINLDGVRVSTGVSYFFR